MGSEKNFCVLDVTNLEGGSYNTGIVNSFQNVKPSEN